MIRQFRVAALCLIGLAAGAQKVACARAEEINIGITATAKPFYIDDGAGNISGFNVELSRLLCARMAVKCRLETAAFPRLLSGVSEGVYQIGFGNVLKNPEREKTMLFSLPIWRSTSSFIAPADLKPTSADGIALIYRICVINKSAQQKFLAAQGGPPEHLIDLPTFRDIFQALGKGTCELAMMPTVNALDFLSSENGQGYDYFGPPLDQPGLAGDVHIIVGISRPELLNAVNDAFTDISRDGSYRKLIQHYFPFDIL